MATTPLKFKTPECASRFLHVHPTLIAIICDMALWALSQNVPFVVTDSVSTLQEDLELKRVSTSHRECRAADISIRGWTDDVMKRFKEHFEKKYPDVGAISQSGIRNLVVIHDNGNGLHIHTQLAKTFAMEFKGV